MQPCPPWAIERERGRVFAGELDEAPAPSRARCWLTRSTLPVASFHAGDVLQLEQARHGLDRHVDHRARRDVVDDDRDADRVVDRLEVLVEALLGRLVVVRRDDQHRVGARLLRVTGEVDRLAGVVRAGAGDHRHPALRPSRCRSRPPACARRGSASGSRRWCRPAPDHGYPPRSATRHGRRNPSSSTAPSAHRCDQRGNRSSKHQATSLAEISAFSPMATLCRVGTERQGGPSARGRRVVLWRIRLTLNNADGFVSQRRRAG